MPTWDVTSATLVSNLKFQNQGNTLSAAWATIKNNAIRLPFGRKIFPAVIVQNRGSWQEIYATAGPLNSAQLLTDKFNSINHGSLVLSATQNCLCVSTKVHVADSVDRLLSQVHEVHDVAAFLHNAYIATERPDKLKTSNGPRAEVLLKTRNTNRRTKVIASVIGLAIAAIIAIVIANASSPTDASYNAGFSTGYALKGQGNAVQSCNSLWPGGTTYDRSAWMSGCEDAINS